MAPEILGTFEYLVLLALSKLRPDEAYGMPVRRLLSEALGKDVAIGAVYTTLDRLKSKGYVCTRSAPDTSGDRHGNAKRFFELQAAGQRAIRDQDRALATVRNYEPIGGEL